jgi:S1-C subfamily serine protease
MIGTRFPCHECGSPASWDALVCAACSRPLQVARSSMRFFAFCLDLLLLSFACVFLAWLHSPWWSYGLLYILLLEIGFRVHGSIGKATLGLTVATSGRLCYYIRETVGKLASLMTFGIGFMMSLTEEKLALHDYIGRTRVVVARPPQPAHLALAFSLVAVAVSFVGYHLGLKNQQQVAPGVVEDQLRTVLKHASGVLTLYGFDEGADAKVQGSGFLVSGEGMGVTNLHVLDDIARAEARLGDGRIFHVLRVHAYSSDDDLAVFQLGREFDKEIQWARDMPFVPLGSSDGLRVGDRIAAISSPEGLSNTLSEGIVSGIREQGANRVLQITAPISEGSSGGPVFDHAGAVVGVATFQLQEGQNLNFAIPVEKVKSLLSRHDNLSFSEFRRKIEPSKRGAGSDSFTFVFHRGWQLLEQGCYQEALAQFLRAQEINPDHPASYLDAGLCREHMGEELLAALEYQCWLSLVSREHPKRASIVEWLESRGYEVPPRQ